MPGGQAIKIRLAATDFNDAMTFAVNDLKTNWEKYKSDFLKKVR